MIKQSKALTWAGWIIAGLLALMLFFSATMKFVYPPLMAEDWVNKFGYPEKFALAIGVVELGCLVLYLIPRTAVLGAVLLTGYLGGAVATHVRINDVFVPPIIVGIFVWLGLYLRDPRIRALLPFREPLPTTEKS
jgi:hypothetical protein